jgi:hypothetical protein
MPQTKTFRALGDTLPAKIVLLPMQQELCACDMAAVRDLSESAI